MQSSDGQRVGIRSHEGGARSVAENKIPQQLERNVRDVCSSVYETRNIKDAGEWRGDSHTRPGDPQGATDMLLQGTCDSHCYFLLSHE